VHLILSLRAYIDPLALRSLRMLGTLLRYLWASPTTAVGLLFLPTALLTGGRARVVTGVIEIHGGLARLFLRYCTLLRGGASAMALGHVVLGVNEMALDMTRSHERIHVRQAERWGPLFIPVYLLLGLITLLSGRHFHRDHPFEREAFAHG